MRLPTRETKVAPVSTIARAAKVRRSNSRGSRPAPLFLNVVTSILAVIRDQGAGQGAMMRAMRFGVAVLALFCGFALGMPDAVALDIGTATHHGR